ncbi:MAG: aminotransferase class I/II-fold pyridoxal phosphate-dependent enzyme [Bdellovibrionales bacterium]|nr:aminotransferase class I/II-fold pyridoxal phosphate-dependent enzyme [Bdellovibrionales bacterium]
MRPRTVLQHLPPVEVPSDNRPLVAPVYQSVKFTLSSLEEVEALFSGNRAGFMYSRVSNPTGELLIRTLASLQQRAAGELFSSGVAALSAVLFALLKSGDHAVCFYECYKPTRFILSSMLGKFGVTSSFVHIDDLETIERALSAPNTKLVIFETPTNPVTRAVDIAWLCERAQSRGILTVCDNTFAGFHNHGQYPIDFFIHSLTKYAGGHGDVMGGVVLTSKEHLRPLREFFIDYGAALDPGAAAQVLKGMKTYFLRYESESKAACEIARWLETRAEISKVLHPSLESHPDHQILRRQMKGFGSIISFDLKGGEAALRKFINALKLFQLTGSLGSTESLVAPARLFYGGDLDSETCRKAGISPGTIRLSIGLEDIEDLKEDLAQALASL